ncbi:MAG: Tol-Pal system beta propeller repeat protein TolB [Deltaproteobacteria bacterium]|nr:Tol-Pal system beta propeller repeat protein TolB [Deltaproteobacteria bacterium]
MTRCSVLVLALSLLAAGAALGQAPIVGDIEGKEFRPFPIAVTELRLAPGAEGHKSAAQQLVKIVRADLDLTGAFKVLDPKSFIDTDGLTQSTVRFPDWLNIGAAGLVKAQLKEEGGKLAVELHGFEVASAKEGLTKTVSGAKDDVRGLAHALSDEIYRYFTGEPGVFRTRIAFVRKVQGEKHVFVTDIDGQGGGQVTKGGGLNLLPSFAPDGRSLVFTSYRLDNPDLYELALGDGSLKRLSSRPGLNTGGRISPDGSKIALTLSQDGNSEIYLLDRGGGLLKRLTSSWGIDTSPAWSPDGANIAFVSSRAGNPQLYVMGSSGGEPKRVTFQGTYNQTPAYSPRGTHLAFTARDERNVFDIFVLDLRTNQIARVTQDQGNNEEPSIAPNGRMLVFSTTRSGARQLVVSNLDGTKQTVITTGGEHSSPSWGPFVK